LEIHVPTHDFAWILEVQDDSGVRRVPLGHALVLGSGRGADVVLADRTVSGRHCALRVLAAGVEVEDLGSRNGTFIGGARVQRARATFGTTLTLGRSSIVLSTADPLESEVDESVQPLPGVAGGSLAMRRVAAQVARLAKLSAPVLVTGESGTGKELVAHALHQEGPRASRPFIAMNVAALPRDLVESEMFGHERGAFTGALRGHRGAFVDADGGTLFLDEIGELPLDAQPKLLRALDGYEVRRVGASGSGTRADVRLVAATHVPLERRVAEGRFRRDLFHRLEVFVIELPPLRARRGDVAPIARALLARAANEIGELSLTPEALAKLTAHEWPGNVRELRNVLYRAAEQARGGTIQAADVERALRSLRLGPAEHPGVAKAFAPTAISPEAARAWLDRYKGNLSAAARAAQIPRTSFRKLLMGRSSGTVREGP
jgi:DNA-binding NtrC family response regulator